VGEVFHGEETSVAALVVAALGALVGQYMFYLTNRQTDGHCLHVKSCCCSGDL